MNITAQMIDTLNLRVRWLHQARTTGREPFGIKTGDRQMDARYAMADAYKALRRAGMEATEFEAEINNCTDSTDAYRIALKWQAIANKKVVA